MIVTEKEDSMSKPVNEMATLQWAGLKDINDIEPLNDSDKACLAEVRDVLKRHSKMARFGVNLLHKHFDLAEDEILVEFIDSETRTLVIKPVKKTEVGTVMETNWVLGDGESQAMLACVVSCNWSTQGAVHTGQMHFKQ
jgi:hypothetical protein